jgi:hypothetical protein
MRRKLVLNSLHRLVTKYSLPIAVNHLTWADDEWAFIMKALDHNKFVLKLSNGDESVVKDSRRMWRVRDENA